MKTVSRVYDSYSQASAAVHALEKAGIPASDISLVANKYVSAKYENVDEVSDAAKGAGVGGAVGGAAGLLAGLGLIAIPGIGPVVAAGWLAATALGAAAGAATGGIAGALIDAGEERQHADVYAESIRRGGTLVTARVADDLASKAEAVMAGYKPVDPVLRGEEYRKEGWKTFDAKAPPYQPNQAEIARMRANWPG
jgi:hypothetical protein